MPDSDRQAGADEIAGKVADAIKAQLGDLPFHDLSAADDLTNVLVTDRFDLRLLAQHLLTSFEISPVRS